MKKYVKSSDKTIKTKTQAKEVAKRILRHQIDNAGYWEESSYDNDGYTESEIMMINEELEKLSARLLKLL